MMMKCKMFSWRVVLLALLVTIVLFIAHYLSSFLEKLVVDGLWYGWILLFIWYFVFMLITIGVYLKFVKVK
jgi:hypothetical protein